ncbi:AAA family ATPase [Paracoccus marinaquae]|uniref:AAA family ATPase n=1 Tax=Paracoccus marinaquae TaxID=2841926 RepID=A0ABS6AIV4_9RHOB|nr:AAA family ATPase [Paracoccus marinaquae]
MVHDPAWFYPATEHRRAVIRAETAIEQPRPVTLLIGGAGIGKTLLQRMLAARCRDRFLIARIDRHDRLHKQPLQAALEAFGLKVADAPPAELLDQARLFLQEGQRDGLRPLLIVDDAQMLSEPDLAQIRVLAEAGMAVLLAGRDDLSGRLEAWRADDLIADQVDVPPFRDSETAGYVPHRFALARCPCHRGISPFDVGSLKVLHHWSGGVPGVLNDLMQHCLRAAGATGTAVIGAGFVDNCLRGTAIAPPVVLSPAKADTGQAKPSADRSAADAAPIDDPKTPLPPLRAVPAGYLVSAETSGRWPGAAGLILLVLPVLAVVGLGLWWLQRPDPAGEVPEAIAIAPATIADRSMGSELPEVADASPDAPHLPPVTELSTPPDPVVLMDEALAAGPDQAARAALLYQRAALWGQPRAAYYLGQAFETGEGVSPDLNRARGWYSLAIGVWGAEQRLGALAGNAPPAGRVAAPVPTMQAAYPDGRVEIHWQNGEGDSPAGFLIEYVTADGGGEIQRIETERTAILLPGPVERWRVIALGRTAADAEASGWNTASPPQP